MALMQNTADSVRHRNSEGRADLIFCLDRIRDLMTTSRLEWSSGPCCRWHGAEFMTTSGADSTGMPLPGSGACRILKKCFMIRRSSRQPIQKHTKLQVIIILVISQKIYSGM